MQEPLPETRHGTEVGRIAPYFVEWVRTQLDARYGNALYKQGLRVYTSLDLEMQRSAQAAMDSGWARIENTPGYRTRRTTHHGRHGPAGGHGDAVRAGHVHRLDPQSGEVRALVGGRDFADSKFNRATQALRQPGSTFKPFVYYAAINSGIPASQIMYDAPVMIDMWDGSVYSPRNFDPDFRGPLTHARCGEALREYDRRATRQRHRPRTVARTAREFGLRTPVPAYPSMPIGSPDVIPMQLAEAYTVFANGGSRSRARPILRVEDAAGRVLWEPQPDVEQVANPQAVAIARDLLQTR
jgi:membrane carboxypeptidase/penicillin-binding protein